MADIAKRFISNPILRPEDVKPSIAGMKVECLLNPGAFRFKNRIGLLLRVAERPEQKINMISTPVIDPETGIKIIEIRKDDPQLNSSDPRVFTYKGESYLTTLSHLRLAWSEDGIEFKAEDAPTLMGEGNLETFGIEDCRVTEIEGNYILTYSAVSRSGVGIGMRITKDWRKFKNIGMIMPPHNKDAALFTEKINGRYYCLHRPSGCGIGGSFIWIAESPDMIHWGNHRCIAMTRPGFWDEERIGAGAAPVKTEKGWLEIYHGADKNSRYCLGAILLELNDPSKVIARTDEPIMEPQIDYEKRGFFGNVVFTNGQIVDGDKITVYYGASDSIVCGAELSIKNIFAMLKPVGIY